MTLARKNSINKNVGFEIEKSMIFLTPFSNYALLLKGLILNSKKLYSSNQGKAEDKHLESFKNTHSIYKKLRRIYIFQVESR
jgi:hypothetical protein